MGYFSRVDGEFSQIAISSCQLSMVFFFFLPLVKGAEQSEVKIIS